MSHPLQAFAATRIFDGLKWSHESALLVAEGRLAAIVPQTEIPLGAKITQLDTGFLCPGFVDLQVNGGGGVLLNNASSLEGIRTICATHLALGTTSILPTLISSDHETLGAALAAAVAATIERVPGFAGLHLEGPHLSPAKAGAHARAHLRPMQTEDVTRLIAARQQLPHLLVTLAPEAATPAQVSALVAAGIVVSLGHSNASYEDAKALFAAGASMVTHLFNAMSAPTARAPGLVGAALDAGVHTGLIADGHHVHPANIRWALKAADNAFLVSDAMAITGTNRQYFMLDGKTVHRRGGTLTFADGTLAGADLTMATALRYMHHTIGLPLERAIRMATTYPAIAMSMNAGTLSNGAPADFIHLGDNLGVQAVWTAGMPAP